MVTLREARWWVLAGVAWAILSSPILFYPPVREVVYGTIGAAIEYLFILLPIVWTILILSVVYPDALQSPSAIAPSLLLSAFLGGLAGYILRIIFKAITGR